VVDNALDLVDGPALPQGVAHDVDLAVVELRVSQQLVHERTRLGRELLTGEGDEDRALALAEVVTRGLARDRGVSEDAQEVIPELVGDPEGQAECAQRGELFQIRTAERRADGQRRFDAVLGRLVDDDPVSAGEGVGLGLPGPCVLLEDVEVLARDHLRAHTGELRAPGAPGTTVGELRRARVEQLVAPPEEQVAEQQRSRLPEVLRIPGPALIEVHGLEALVRRRLPSSSVRAVHDVVVHEGGRMEHLERGRGEHDAGQVRRDVVVREGIETVGNAARGLPAPVAEECAKPLAAREKRSGDIGESHELRCDRLEVGRTLGEEFVDSQLNEVN